ncbi:Pectinesterase 5 [Raphanus sativus]|uniref:Pectinesterase n=1 Tax=Raphanus sativus TaxID=3726 RepID=A0A6J0JYY3_RAPSA|nr:pectinesterase 5 [Raphanus sativus]KAJ4892500.1 Pectinesterase 5 [Raphanus sativus]
MIGKVVVSVASVLLLVGVAIGVVAIVNKSGNTNLSPQMKAVQGICQTTADKASCVKTLEPVKSDDPNKLIKAFMLATQDAITKSSNFTDKTEGNMGSSISPNNKAVLDYCRKVFMYALEDLGTILEEMGEDLNTIGNKFDQIKQWLTGVYNYQTDCLDDIQEDDLRKTIAEGIASSKILTGNAIDIFHTVVSAMAKIDAKVDDFKNMTSGIFTPSDKGSAPAGKEATPVDTPVADPDGPSRRLLEDLDDLGVPTWVSGADRKLMANAGRGRRGGGGAPRIRATYVVAKDGSGQFKSIQQAVNACPDKNAGRCIIHIKAGIYREQVIIPKKKNNIFMFGDGARKTVITYNRSVGLSSGTTTSTSGTVQVESEGFMAKWIGFKNTAGPNGHQAVAIRVNGDRAVIFNCRFDGYQDTLYVNNGRQFYRNCVVSGTVDFIFGKSATVIQNSLIVIRKGNKGQYNTVTADGNEKGLSMKIGIVIQNCRIVPDKKLAAERLTVESYLGRPWKQFSTTVVINTEIGDVIRPEGWRMWDGENFHKSCRYVEYNNRGPGAITNRRVSWAKVARSAGEINQYTVANWLAPVNWIQEANVPVTLGL